MPRNPRARRNWRGGSLDVRGVGETAGCRAGPEGSRARQDERGRAAARETRSKRGSPRRDSAISRSWRRSISIAHADCSQQENDREAAAELDRALYLSPYLADAHLLLGRIHLRNGRVREAIDALKISLWSAETADAHAVLADAYRQAKDAGPGPRGSRARARARSFI